MCKMYVKVRKITHQPTVLGVQLGVRKTIFFKFAAIYKPFLDLMYFLKSFIVTFIN